MGIVWQMLIGGLVGVVLGVLFEQPLKRLLDRAWRWARHLVRRHRAPVLGPETFSFGSIPTSWVVLDGTGELEYTPQSIECRYDPTPLELPGDLLALRQRIEEEELHKREQGQPYQWNGLSYSLERFVISRTDLEENLQLQLCFRPSDYYTFLATAMNLDAQVEGLEGEMVTVRDKYVTQADWQKPVRYISNSFGVDLAVITSDDYLLVAQRSVRVGSRPGEFNISANEGVSRLLDRSSDGDKPDMYRAAMRGAAEELGVEVKPRDVVFLSFGVDTRYCQWGLLGMARVPLTLEQVTKARQLGIKDKWENTRLHGVRFEADEVVAFVCAHGPWAPGALACIYHTLVHEYGRPKVEAALSKSPGPRPVTRQ